MDERIDLIKIIIENHGLLQKSRKRELVSKKRYLIYFMLKENILNGNLTQIGALFGNDHATVIHARKVHLQLTETKDKDYLNICQEMQLDLDAVMEEYNKCNKTYAANITFYINSDCPERAKTRIEAIFNTLIAKNKVLTGIAEVSKEEKNIKNIL